ncbi:MAG: AMP-binding protein, partial [Bacillota bacterium]|nr:AMP-binding protein [Bacillota bacterium]
MGDALSFSWLQSYPDGVRSSLEYPQQPLTFFLEEAAAHWPDQTATVFFGKRISYRKLLESVQRFAAALADLGVKKGDRVAMMLPNCPQAVISYYGILLTGAVVVPINPVNVERELIQQLRDVDCHTIVYLDTRHPLIASVREKAGIEHGIVTGLQEYMPALAGFNYRYRQQRKGRTFHVPPGPGVIRFQEFLARTDKQPAQVPIDPEEDLAVLQYTGGTTGTPKAAMLTHYNLVANALQIKEWFMGCRHGEEVFLAVLPFFHVYGMTAVLNVAVELAATLVIHPRYDTEQVLSDIERHKVTIFPGTPAMYAAINSHKNTPYRNLSSIRACVSGAAALSPDVARAFEEITGGTLVEGYGLTEASPVTHCNPLTGTRKAG